MRRSATALTLFFLATFLAASPGDVGNRRNDLAGFGIRSDGTAGERSAIDYVADALEEMGIPYEERRLDSGDRGHSYSSNLIATIPGNRPERIVLATPIDGGAYSASLLLELASSLTVNPPKHTIILAFLGAEKGETEFHPYGSRMAAESLSGDDDVFVLYIESEEIPGRWRFKVGGNKTVAPYWLVDKTAEVISSEFIPYRIRGTDIHAARLGLQGDVGALATWLAEGIPAVGLTGERKAKPEDRLRRTERFLAALKTLDQNIDGIPDESENIYVFIRPLSASSPRLIPELPFIAVFLAVTAIMMALPLFQMRSIRLNLRRFSRFWWTWPLLFVLVFLFLFLSTLIVEETVLLADFPDLWNHAPGIFLFFKLAVAGALTLNFILITQGLPLPRSPHFYSYGAIFAATLSLLTFVVLDITMAMYPLWVIVIFLFFTMTKNVRRKVLLLVLSPVPYVMGAVVSVREPYLAVLRFLLLDRITANVFLALVILPLIFGIASLSYWRMHYHRTRLAFVTPAATLALSLSAVVTLIWILGLRPYGPASPQPVELVDYIDVISGDRRLALSSPGPVGDAVLTLDGVDYALEGIGRNAEIRTQKTASPLEMTETSRTFLGRRTITVTISGDTAPSGLEIVLRSTSPFTLHEANFPFEMAPAGTSARFFIGANPPSPTVLEFTVNGDAELNLTAMASWRNPENPPSVNRADLEDTVVRRVRAGIQL